MMNQEAEPLPNVPIKSEFQPEDGDSSSKSSGKDKSIVFQQFDVLNMELFQTKRVVTGVAALFYHYFYSYPYNLYLSPLRTVNEDLDEDGKLLSLTINESIEIIDMK